jgi:hypothetical protein
VEAVAADPADEAGAVVGRSGGAEPGVVQQVEAGGGVGVAAAQHRAVPVAEVDRDDRAGGGGARADRVGVGGRRARQQAARQPGRREGGGGEHGDGARSSATRPRYGTEHGWPPWSADGEGGPGAGDRARSSPVVRAVVLDGDRD